MALSMLPVSLAQEIVGFSWVFHSPPMFVLFVSKYNTQSVSAGHTMWYFFVFCLANLRGDGLNLETPLCACGSVLDVY